MSAAAMLADCPRCGSSRHAEPQRWLLILGVWTHRCDHARPIGPNPLHDDEPCEPPEPLHRGAHPSARSAHLRGTIRRIGAQIVQKFQRRTKSLQANRRTCVELLKAAQGVIEK